MTKHVVEPRVLMVGADESAHLRAYLQRAEVTEVMLATREADWQVFLNDDIPRPVLPEKIDVPVIGPGNRRERRAARARRR